MENPRGSFLPRPMSKIDSVKTCMLLGSPSSQRYQPLEEWLRSELTSSTSRDSDETPARLRQGFNDASGFVGDIP
ncbi:unnamed protein product [Linum trigynum]|uniref:Uncharacterized protein n=1 Tax=Linum trigynum TaxID=586398 RepID=A0AAV2DAH2_9ROSI